MVNEQNCDGECIDSQFGMCGACRRRAEKAVADLRSQLAEARASLGEATKERDALQRDLSEAKRAWELEDAAHLEEMARDRDGWMNEAGQARASLEAERRARQEAERERDEARAACIEASQEIGRLQGVAIRHETEHEITRRDLVREREGARLVEVQLRARAERAEAAAGRARVILKEVGVTWNNRSAETWYAAKDWLADPSNVAATPETAEGGKVYCERCLRFGHELLLAPVPRGSCAGCGEPFAPPPRKSAGR